MKSTLETLLAPGRPVLADGAMGTLLTAQGLPAGTPPPLWNAEQPEKVQAVHRAYIEAGAQIILTNSFVASRVMLDRYGLGERAAELNRAAAEIARAVADAADRPVVVAGSIGPTGAMLEPYGTLSFADAQAAFAEQAAALADGGVDVFWVETMSDLEEARAAVEGCREAAPDVPVVATMTFDTGGRTMMGTTPEQALEALSGMGAAALGATAATARTRSRPSSGRCAPPPLTRSWSPRPTPASRAWRAARPSSTRRRRPWPATRSRCASWGRTSSAGVAATRPRTSARWRRRCTRAE
ncbi:MAG: homocysteine S-methyltransferase family protein [Anaerolineae bacterium]|nr:homocysteine S-methyltransferase family protein [Anaerolineae bacterium]